MSASAAVTATFSESIQASTLSFVLKTSAGASVAATVSYDDTAHVATLRPSTALAAGTTYTATVGGAQDQAGAAHDEPGQLVVHHGGRGEPAAGGHLRDARAGSTGIAQSAAAMATFSESIQASSLSFVLKTSAGASVAATVSYDDATHTVTLRPSAVASGRGDLHGHGKRGDGPFRRRDGLAVLVVVHHGGGGGLDDRAGRPDSELQPLRDLPRRLDVLQRRPGHQGDALSSTLLGSSLMAGGNTFRIGAAGSMNVIRSVGQKIALPSGNYSTLKFLATSIGGNLTGVPFVVTYADGSTATLKQSISDWTTPQGYAGETKALTMGYRNQYNGTKQTGSYSLYQYSLALDPTKKVASITLPNQWKVHVLAIDLVS